MSSTQFVSTSTVSAVQTSIVKINTDTISVDFNYSLVHSICLINLLVIVKQLTVKVETQNKVLKWLYIPFNIGRMMFYSNLF
jgi:hypothetical protein